MRTAERKMNLSRSGPLIPSVRGIILAAAAISLTFAAAGCAAPNTIFTPDTDQALALRNLFILLIVLSAIVMIGVEAVLIYVIWRYRQRPGAGPVRQIAGHRNLEIAWTAIPVVILIIIFAFTVPALSAIEPATAAEAGEEPLRIDVIGNQWWWEYRYSAFDIVTANELHVPVRVPITLVLYSDDVIHSYWVPSLNGKLDLIPGQVNVLGVEINEPGFYRGQCAEFCGVQHAKMLIPVWAHEPAEFAEWVQIQQTVPPPPTDPLVLAGREIFLSNTCVNCHTVEGTPAGGDFGPNLTHFGIRNTIGTGVLENEPEELALWINAIDAVKPGVHMPGYDFTEEELIALVAYLESLR